VRGSGVSQGASAGPTVSEIDMAIAGGQQKEKVNTRVEKVLKSYRAISKARKKR